MSLAQRGQLTMFASGPEELPTSPPGRSVCLFVEGIPRPQGSVTSHPIRNKAGEVVGSAIRYSERVMQWRAQLYTQLSNADLETFEGPVRLSLIFDLPRPRLHYGTGRNAGLLRPSALPWPAVAPDLDKLCRAVCDACTDAGVWKNDGQVVTLIATKRYGVQSGVTIIIANVSEEGS